MINTFRIELFKCRFNTAFPFPYVNTTYVFANVGTIGSNYGFSLLDSWVSLLDSGVSLLDGVSIVKMATSKDSLEVFVEIKL